MQKISWTHRAQNTNSQGITDPNVRAKTTELLEENVGENLRDLRVGKEFPDRTPKDQSW